MTALDSAGKPAPHASVTLIARDRMPKLQDLHRSITADADGVAKFKSVPPGDYTIWVFQELEQGAPLDPDFRKPFEKQAVAVKVEPGGHQSVRVHVITANP